MALTNMVLEWGSYYIPIKATNMTQEVRSKDKTYEDVCVKDGTPKRDMLMWCPKCNATTETVRNWLKEDVGTKDIWDYEQVSYTQAIANMPRLDKWVVIEENTKAKLSAKDKMTMVKKNPKLSDLLKELATTRTVLKCLFVARSRGVVREAYLLPSGLMMTTSPTTVVKEEFKEKFGVVSIIKEMVAEVGSVAQEIPKEEVKEAVEGEKPSA